MARSPRSLLSVLWLLPPVIGTLTAVAAIAWTGFSTSSFGDAKDYTVAARAILEGSPYPRQSSLPFFRAPLYPAFMAAVWAVVPGSAAAIKLAQALVFGLTCGLVYRLGLAIHGSQGAAIVGGLLLALDPLAVATTTDIQSETLHMALVTAALLALVHAVQAARGAMTSAAVSGALFGLASLCRPSALPVAAVLAVVLCSERWRSGSRRAAFTVAGSMLAAMALTIAPWTFANWRATGAPILITDAAGYHLWLGNQPAALRLYRGDFSSPTEMSDYGYRYLQKELPAQAISEWDRGGAYRSRSLSQREALWREAAIRQAKADPGLTLQLWALKTWAYWRPWLHPVVYSRSSVLLSALAGLGSYALAILGAFQLRSQRGSGHGLRLLLALLVASTLVHTISHSMVRFRVPYASPAIAMLAGLGLTRLATPSSRDSSSG